MLALTKESDDALPTVLFKLPSAALGKCLAQSLLASFLLDEGDRRNCRAGVFNAVAQWPPKPNEKTQQRRTDPPPQTNEPFEQEADRPIGQHGAAGRPPLMKK